MPTSMDDIRFLELTRYPTPTKLVTDIPPPIPSGVVVTGQQGLLRVQWTPQVNVDGYDIAVMTTQNLAAPDINIERKVGSKCREFVYPTGNVALTRYFAVRSFLSDVYSGWSPIVTGLSVVFGAPESAPPSPPVNPPSGDEPPPSGDAGPRTGLQVFY